MPAGHLEFSEIVLRLFVAAGCGAVLGIEREYHKKPAGLRTLILVSVGCATFILVGLDAQAEAGVGEAAANTSHLTQGLIQGVMQGIGFLGAGAILQSQGSVRGVLTAAAVWICGAVGAACGFGDFRIAGLACGLALFTVVVFGFLERRTWKEEPD